MPQMSEMMEGSLEGCVYCFLCFLFYPQEIFKFFLYINNFQRNTDLCLTQSEILFFFSLLYLERNGNGQDAFQCVIQQGLGLFSSAECGLFWSQSQLGLGCEGNTVVVSPAWSIWLQLDLPYRVVSRIRKFLRLQVVETRIWVPLMCCTSYAVAL